MDTAVCGETLSRLVAEETAALTELAGILDVEHAALVANDADALISAGASRQRHVNALVRIEQERRALCRAMGVAADLRGLQSLLKQADPAHAVAKRWAECVALATRCRRANDRNGALVAARMKHVEQVLSLITRNTAGTYGRRGSALRVAAGRVVSARA
jgi:flagellar biosynthesis/type III secretory pathway chaperone